MGRKYGDFLASNLNIVICTQGIMAYIKYKELHI